MAAKTLPYSEMRGRALRRPGVRQAYEEARAKMPRRKSEDSNGVQDEQQEDAAAEAEAVETPEAQAEPEYAPEETQTEERAGAPVRRLVKLADRPTMYLVENGKRRPVTESHVAAALLIPVEVVEEDELSEWPEGEPLA